MWRLIGLSLIQSLSLIGSQIFLKFAMQQFDHFIWSWQFFKSQLLNWQLALSGIFIALATVLWFYIIRHFEFSIAYPLISISYIWGILAAVLIFHENVPFVRYVGIALIIAGVICIVQK
jgi:drug/metabolite transporter (DMT)-like permease